MNYEWISRGLIIKKGKIQAIGESVYDMTKIVLGNRSTHVETRIDFDFVDVSNEWKFSAEDENENQYIIRFALEGVIADKFGIED